jgi:hypothetical protein
MSEIDLTEILDSKTLQKVCEMAEAADQSVEEWVNEALLRFVEKYLSEQ